MGPENMKEHAAQKKTNKRWFMLFLLFILTAINLSLIHI